MYIIYVYNQLLNGGHVAIGETPMALSLRVLKHHYGSI